MEDDSSRAPLQVVNEEKDIEVIVESNLSFREHTSDIVRK